MPKEEELNCSGCCPTDHSDVKHMNEMQNGHGDIKVKEIHVGQPQQNLDHTEHDGCPGGTEQFQHGPTAAVPWACPSLIHHGGRGDTDRRRSIVGSTLGAAGAGTSRLIPSTGRGVKATLACFMHAILLMVLAPIVSFAIFDLGLVAVNCSTTGPLSHPSRSVLLSLFLLV